MIQKNMHFLGLEGVTVAREMVREALLKCPPSSGTIPYAMFICLSIFSSQQKFQTSEGCTGNFTEGSVRQVI